MATASERPRLSDSEAIRIAAGVAFVVLAMLGILNTRFSAVWHRKLTERPHDEATIPSANTIRILALGHREWAADLLWSAALVYFGDTLVARQEQRFLQAYADTMEEVDPQFRQAYLWGAMVSVYNTRVIRRESVENAIRHLERGLHAFPDDGEITYQLYFNYYFELPPLLDDPDQRNEVRRRGAEYARRAALLGWGPPWMGLAAADALEHAGLNDRALDALRDLYLRNDDPQIRATIEAQIHQLLGERGSEDPYLAELERVDAERRASFPYMGMMLYLFVGPPVAGVAHRREPLEPAPSSGC